MRWLVLLLMILPCVFGATIHGNVYDFALDLVDDAVIEISTTPHQVIVAKDSLYSFEAPKGTYTISAMKDEQIIHENITVLEDGRYRLDLILLPDLSVEEALLDYSDVEAPDIIVPDDESGFFWAYVLTAVIIIAAIILFIYRKKSKKHADPQLKIILDFIQKRGGRTSQKEIYKNVPWSEAKVSLMLDDLESQKIIKRVKKGRTNLVFKK